MNNETEKNVTKKKPSRQKYIIASVCFALFVIVALVEAIFDQEPKPDPDSEKVIRLAAAEQLRFQAKIEKEPNDLTDEDFAKITNFYLQQCEIADLKFLDKFINLKSLAFIDVQFPQENIPGWVKSLEKLGIINFNKLFLIELNPVSKLTNIESIQIYGTQFKNIKPFSNLHNLKELVMVSTQVSNIKPLSDLTKMENLTISDTLVSDIKPLKNLKNLRGLALARNHISNIEPIKGLTNLQSLVIWETQLPDLEPIKSLINLQKLNLSNYPSISDEQVEDLQVALPNLKITR
ncbi:MAG: hypothetical protein JW787_11245 [Sedimentisphaerales bacterium]|nr:hypothetical protein [Sedimentisphaerales bacterium]